MVVFFRTFILYTFVVIVMRIMGKRQIGELQPFELVIAIMLSELAAVPMQDTGIPLIHGLIPILTLMALEIIISFLTLKFRPLRKIICGTPSILIKDGRVKYDELKKQRFNLDDLMEELRMLGYLNISDIEYAVMETSGKISIIPKADKASITKGDIKLNAPEEQLPVGIILDGCLDEATLKKAGRDMNWLHKELNKNHIGSIEDVFIGMLDSQGNFFVQRRNSDEKKRS
jgi:uncharacterized membrane protein YcaP (DUF421 family)